MRKLSSLFHVGLVRYLHAPASLDLEEPMRA